ncbi:hypothetical protein [Baekduia sp. Peel2402]|uniref:hypothetical protein n=1 Tax=Baekduia sp. Peel2402 TaxID=3458296 RepID=UPI00403E785A
MAAEFHLRATPSAAKAIEGLRGNAKKAYEKLLPQLKAQGCKVAGYRLLAADGVPEGSVYLEFCCKSLTGTWRLITTGQRRDEKPACCGEPGWPTLGKSRRERQVGAP